MKKLLSWCSSLVLVCFSLTVSADPPSTSRYYTDAQVMYNNDPTTDAFSLVSTVACFLSNVKPEYNADGNTYVAWLQYGKCDSNMSTKSSTTLPYEKAAIKATYNGTTGNLNVKLWLTGWEDDDSTGTVVYTPSYIWVNVDVTAGPAAEPPLGRWNMQFCVQSTPPQPATGSADPTSCDNGFGYATVNPAAISVYMQGFRGGVKQYEVQGTTSYTVSGGKVNKGDGEFTIYEGWNGGTTNRYAFAFDGDIYKLRTTTATGTNDVCTNRNIDAVTPLINSWNGWLYNVTTGAAVDLTGGFNLKLSSGTVTDWSKTGWVGYWGLWFPDKDSAGNAISVTEGQMLYGNGKDTMDVAYTYKRAKGSMQRLTISKGSYDAVKNTRVSMYLNANILGLLGQTPGQEDTGNYQLYWNGVAFVVEGKFSSDGQSLDTGSGKTGTLTLAQLAGVRESNLWAGIPNASIGIQFTIGTWNYNSNSVTPADPSAADVYQTVWEDIYPGTPESGNPDLADGTELLCYGDRSRCPTVSGSGIQARSKFGASGSVNPVRYRWDAASGNLTYTNGGITYIVSSAEHRNIGPMLESTADITPYACNQTNGAQTGFYSPDDLDNPTTWNFVQGGTCSDRAWSVVGTSYQWTTNTSTVNWPSRGFIVRASDGKRPVFDKPISVTYTPASGAFTNKAQYMSYNGGGQFWIPSTCYDRSTRQETSCNGNNLFWANNFDIPFATTDAGKVTNQQNPSTQYLVKFLGKSFLYGASTDALCTTMTLPSGLTLPTQADWKDPHATASTNYLGAWQKPDAAPKYVDGVTQ